jgi:hypothetical protein
MRRLSLGSLIRMKVWQQQPFGGGEEIRHVGRRGCVFVGRPVQVGRTLEEERYWNLQNVGDLLQPARSNAVGALLVFLHLLEGEAERIAKLLLAHCKHQAAHAHPTADVLIDWVK